MTDEKIKQLGLELKYTVTTTTGEQYRVFTKDDISYVEIGDVLSPLQPDVLTVVKSESRFIEEYAKYRPEIFVVMAANNLKAEICGGWVNDLNGNIVLDVNYYNSPNTINDEWFSLDNFDRFREATLGGTEDLPSFCIPVGINVGREALNEWLEDEKLNYSQLLSEAETLAANARKKSLMTAIKFYAKGEGTK